MKISWLIASATILAGVAVIWKLLSPAPMMSIGFAAFDGNPVVVKAFILNENRSSLFAERVVGAGGEAAPRTSGSGTYLMGYRKGWHDDLSIELTWVELSSGEAWRAAATVSARDMARSASGAIQLMPILAPGGLMIISSDPMPDNAQDARMKDLASVCGIRVPGLDQDYLSDPRALPGLWEAIQAMGPRRYSSVCES